MDAEVAGDMRHWAAGRADLADGALAEFIGVLTWCWHCRWFSLRLDRNPGFKDSTKISAAQNSGCTAASLFGQRPYPRSTTSRQRRHATGVRTSALRQAVERARPERPPTADNPFTSISRADLNGETVLTWAYNTRCNEGYNDEPLPATNLERPDRPTQHRTLRADSPALIAATMDATKATTTGRPPSLRACNERHNDGCNVNSNGKHNDQYNAMSYDYNYVTCNAATNDETYATPNNKTNTLTYAPANKRTN
ncbi:protein of unknown function (plasmid) [Streptantibioticus cattleyicolor NRRL 8057 = DSM 46488]|nr:protein of unknown function [Streptantibioticus cattleyicolor NRRL 8057 = DSM 46488]